MLGDSTENIVLVVQENPWGAHLIDGFCLKSLRFYRILYQNPSVSAPGIFLHHKAADYLATISIAYSELKIPN
jgi:hypothetical protein